MGLPFSFVLNIDSTFSPPPLSFPPPVPHPPPPPPAPARSDADIGSNDSPVLSVCLIF